jgi:D-glycero-alpha-D-manno-heptose-7-phosphate kinase
MIYRAKAPLRIGLAGGGTDVDPYASLYGGAVVNACISLYAHASIEPINENAIILCNDDLKQEKRFEWQHHLSTAEPYALLAGVYNSIHRRYGIPLTGFRLTVHVDVPLGSGLGTSSTLVVAMVAAFAEMLNLPLGRYDMARMAYEIERDELGFAGGHQDQYAASFGGINFMEFSAGNMVVVNPLAVRPQVMHELENNLLLYYTGHSRQSGLIIEAQQEHVRQQHEPNIKAMHMLKEQALRMKEALLKGRLQDLGELLDLGFTHKRNMAEGISNPELEKIYNAALDAGATGGKISGAGGGGFMLFYCPGNTRHRVMEALSHFSGKYFPFHFAAEGVSSWTI